MALAPGKGVHVGLTETNLEFLTQALETIADTRAEVIDDPSEGEPPGPVNPELLLDALGQKGWKRIEDKFGDKAFVQILHNGSGALRVTVVNTSKGLKLDIRTWFEPE